MQSFNLLEEIIVSVFIMQSFNLLEEMIVSGLIMKSFNFLEELIESGLHHEKFYSSRKNNCIRSYLAVLTVMNGSQMSLIVVVMTHHCCVPL